MNRILLAILFFLSFNTLAQQHEKSDLVLTQLTDFFNKDQFPELYNQLSPEFRTQQTEQSITAFYKTGLKSVLGKIVSWKYQENVEAWNIYLVNFERGQQELKLGVTAEGKIGGMLWKIPKEKKADRDPATVKTNNPKQTKIQLYIDSLALGYLKNPNNNSLSIAVVNDGKTEIFFYGETTKGNGLLPDRNSIYEIGSVSKTFTAIMIAHAVNEGKILLNDDIRKYLPGSYPDLQFNGKPITILSLANQTSGFPRLPENFFQHPAYKESDPYQAYSKEMIYQYLANFKLSQLPGTKAEYSNFGFAVLGTILENVYKVPLDKLLLEMITVPLKMKATGYTVAPLYIPLKTTGYTAEKVAPYWDMAAYRAAGGIKSSLNDMIIYLQENMKNTNKDFSLSHQQSVNINDHNCGLAWMITPVKNNKKLIWHNGATAGFSSFAGFTQDQKKGIVVLNNSDSTVDELAVKILSSLL